MTASPRVVNMVEENSLKPMSWLPESVLFHQTKSVKYAVLLGAGGQSEDVVTPVKDGQV